MSFQEFTGIQYLMIDVANNFGLDKMDWDERLDWCQTNNSTLESLIKQAEEPALYFAAVQALRKAQKGEPSGYPISLDATSSGIQLLAAMTGDRKAAELCNVVNTGHRRDAYVALYKALLAKVGEEGHIDRKSTKQAIMTAFYSSTAIPKQVFGEGKLLELFYETMAEAAPGAWETTEAMLAIWDNTKDIYEWTMPDGFHVKIKVMGKETDYVQFLNHPYEVNYSVNKPIDDGRSLGANSTHSVDGMLVREIVARCDYDPKQIDHLRRLFQYGIKDGSPLMHKRAKDNLLYDLLTLASRSGFFSMRIINLLDNNNIGTLTVEELNKVRLLLNSLPKKPFKVLTIHDCFRVLPNYGNDIRRQYNRLLAEVAESNILSFLVSQMVGRTVTVSKLSKNLASDILDANYALS